MTRDSRRDREALGVTVAWYCPACRESIPIQGETTFEEARHAHVERHRRPVG